MTQKISKMEVEYVLEQVVREKGGDYKDPNAGRKCVYASANGPSCIVGYVFDRFGVLDEIKSDYNSRAAHSLPARIRALFEPSAFTVLTDAQRLQDKGTPWGDVLKKVTQ